LITNLTLSLWGGKKNQTQDKEYLRFIMGTKAMIPALEEALSSMKPGGIRQVLAHTDQPNDETTDQNQTTIDSRLDPSVRTTIFVGPTNKPSQVIVPPELGYPNDDPKHDRVGPKPSTFSGQRALDFVLKNQGLVDKVSWLVRRLSMARCD